MSRVLVFGFDAAESSQIRRIRQLMDAGYEVSAFTMRRRNMNEDFEPFWHNIHLFTVDNERLGKRALVLLLSIFKIAAHLRTVRRADVIVARNFDLLLLAHAARLLSLRWRLPVIYELLDVHGVFTDPSKKGAAFRFVERRLLNASALTAVSSLGFVDNYLRPAQGYRGRVHLIENKIWFGETLPPRRLPAQPAEAEAPITVGWVGSLRCEPSYLILTEAARRVPDVTFAFHGNVHHHVLPDFDGRLRGLGNTAYHGPYRYPEGLSLYRDLDLVWSQDLWQRGANSDWLLPNRIYEASYFGCLSIAVAGTETARVVTERGLGYVVEAPTTDALVALLQRLDRAALEEKRRALLARPAEDFAYTSSDIHRLITAGTAAHAEPHAPRAV